MKIVFVTKLLGLSSILGVSAVSLSACAAGDQIVFANYESYMSPRLESKIMEANDNVLFDYYPSNESMITNFKNGTYTIGVPSTYAIIDLIQEDGLVKIDWNKFGLNKPNNPNVRIQNSQQALSLFTPEVQTLLTSFKDIGIDNLLDYCVPYFFQSYIFAYRGDEIKFNEANPTWSQIFNFIGSSEGAERFGPKNGKENLGAVEDERSLFSVANIVRTTDNNQPISTNPTDLAIKPTIEDYVNVFKYLSEPNRINRDTLSGNPQPIFLNSDSSVILNKLATGALQGAFLFNGDAIFAGYGGEAEGSIEYPTGEDFHIITPKQTVYTLDAMVINKVAINKNPNTLEQAYQLLYEVGLQGSDQDADSFAAIYDTDVESIDEPDYINGPMDNFAYVQYTSPLNVISGVTDSVVANGFFDEPDDAELSKAFLKAYNIALPEGIPIQNVIEAPLNIWQKQAIVNAWARFKDHKWS